MAGLHDRALQHLIDEMTKDGAEAIQRAYDTKTFTNRTMNLRDSYASAVYLDGRLLEDTIRFVDGGSAQATKPRIWKGREIYGRQEVYRYLKAYPPKTRGLSLKLVAAMPYSAVLEGRRNVEWGVYDYKVIKGAEKEMRNLAEKYGKMFKQGMRGITIQENVR